MVSLLLVAILEWLEERFPAQPLLPDSAEGRAVIRSMAAVIDIRPLHDLAVLQHLRALSAWISPWINDGFGALEQLIAVHGQGFAISTAPRSRTAV